MAGTDAVRTERADEPTVTATARRVGDSDVLRYEVCVEDLGEARRLSMVVGHNAAVEETTGVERTDNEGRTRLVWDGDANRARVVISADVDRVAAAEGTPQYYAAEEWVLGPVPFIELHWQTDDGDLRRSHPLMDRDVVSAEGAAWFGDRYALVGNYTVRRASGGGQAFRLVRPRGTEPAPAESAVFDALGQAAADFDVGSKDETVLLFALPGPASGGEAIPLRGEAWVEAEAPLSDPNSIWLHEYVHTRQSFRLASDMQWFREASAEYYAARLAEEQGLVTAEQRRRHVGGRPHRATLTRPGSWESNTVPYRKGTRVLALLDHNIRTVTDGQRSLEDVFRRMNEHEGPIDYATFKTIVAGVAGQPMGSWLDRYVAGPTPVTDLYSEPALDAGYVGPATVETGPGPGAVFFVLSVALSLFAAVPLYVYLAGGCVVVPVPTVRRSRDSRRPGG